MSNQPLTVPALFAYAHNHPPRTGDFLCYYCGASCTDANPASEYVKSSFTGRDGVRAPGSQYVCDGCVLCLQEKATITTLDGNMRTGQKVRGYSWVLMPDKAQACTKADMDYLRETCLNPPEPPFAIVMSDSGQKHLLYRSRISWSREVVTAQLEIDTITYAVSDLTERLQFTKKLVAATGKPALKEEPTQSVAVRLYEHFGDEFESLFNRWESEWQHPVFRLAAWLCPAKEVCLHEHPARIIDGAISSKSGGTSRPVTGSKRPRKEEPERGSHPLFEHLS